MRRADRQDSNYDNILNHPRSQNKEPLSSKELKQLLITVRSQKDELQQRAQEYQKEANDWKERTTQSVCLYNEEKARVIELSAKYEEANAQREQYLTLYNESQEQLKYERRSKASIKGWETRRKQENQRLKQEIAEMTILLHESLNRKDEAVNNLYILAERMDRIQNLVDSVEEEPTGTPVGVLQKFNRIWIAIKEILSE